MTVLQLLRYDRSWPALVSWLLPGAVLLLLGAMGSIGAFGAYQSERYRLSYSSHETAHAVSYGNVVDVEVDNTRVASPCVGAYADRRLVQYYPGTTDVAVEMPIRERSINPQIGRRKYHLIMGIPAQLKPGAAWVYQSQQHDNCGIVQSLLPDDGGWVGRAVSTFLTGKDMAAPDTPVAVATSEPKVPGVAFRPPVPEAVTGGSAQNGAPTQ